MDELAGKSVTEEQIKAWVAEAEAGYDLAALEARGRGRPGRACTPSQVVSVRFTEAELSYLDAQAAQQHVSRSELIRRAVLA